MKKFLVLASIALFVSAQAQPKKTAPAKSLVVGFWNVENLYDTINDPAIDDEEFLPQAASKWNAERYAKKIHNTAFALSKMGIDENTDGAAILGLAEIENKKVLEDLVQDPQLKARKYQIVQYNSPDMRGIDVALLYNPKYFKLLSSSVHTVKLPGDSARPTRDELLVNGILNGQPVHVLVCHWPSRRGGEKESAANRNAAATVARRIIDSLRKSEKSAKIFVMGDLNDDPTDESVKKIVATTDDAAQVSTALMYNPMEKMHAGGKGTLSYKNKWNLFDQILISEGLVKKDGSKYSYADVRINNIPETEETEEKYKGQPLRTYVGKKYLGGYSDHFGVYLILK
ncbi:MAG: Endonuclease/exonuclease/phosphatase [Bacteroidetes bacterium]|jgi:predicted extracellular nuclease|nr:Endonuclease/exonuclease/phosphatase [Bacteroidota bacterium]